MDHSLERMATNEKALKELWYRLAKKFGVIIGSSYGRLFRCTIPCNEKCSFLLKKSGSEKEEQIAFRGGIETDSNWIELAKDRKNYLSVLYGRDWKKLREMYPGGGSQ